MEQFEPGKSLSFRLPSDTPSHVLKYLTENKKNAGRKFSSNIASIFIDAVSQKALGTANGNQMNVPLPKGLTSEELEWINHPHTKALISQLLYQVVKKPYSPFDLNQQPEKNKEENPPAFKANAAIQNFAQKAFLDFDDDDD
ncbi:hypothetical protein [Peribacillus loiseleuriae]|uniref:hypothetical protein n=1 Tax=Peribacillus loiseleuriae TaxID=1679170 RepID=UPI000671772C|nr:hypothetical protein [Peribacillus loiseleuriae]